MCGAELHRIRSFTAVPMPWHSFSGPEGESGAYMFRADPRLIDPFIGIDSFMMSHAVFGPHPHAGMSAVTLMLPEAPGVTRNRDSLGDVSLIRGGDLHWTQAGRGMMHEELPVDDGIPSIGMQVFVNLSAANKQAAPAAFKVKHEDTPVVQIDGGQMRVVAGEFDGARSPIAADPRWLTRVTMLDVTLEPGAQASIPVEAGHNAFFVRYSGNFEENSLLVSDKSASVAIIFGSDGSIAQIKAGGQGLRGVFFSGTPLNEPVFPGGPFMGNTAEDITNYKRAFARGDMGRLLPSR